jgi:hypothetical protein
MLPSPEIAGMCSQKTNLRRAEQLMREQSKREKKAVGAFITACKGDDQSAVAPALNALLKAQAFEPALREACDLGIVPFATRCEILRCFHKSWSELYHLRDEPFVFDALGVLLPKYEGPSVRLYRGMAAEEWESKKYGFCWTSDPDIARQFAWGLEYLQNSSDHDRCVIETLAPESAIISSSLIVDDPYRELEYVVNWQHLGKVILVERYEANTGGTADWA